MARPRIILYIAASLDGYIAAKDGGLDWLHPFGDATAGFTEFTASIGASIMGRQTYEFVRQFAPPSDAATPTYVLTRRPILNAPRHIQPFAGDVRVLAEAARRAAMPGVSAPASFQPATPRDVWLVGGGQAVAALHRAGLIDLYRIFLLPVTLGTGIPLFPADESLTRSLRLVRTHSFPSGAMEVVYEPAQR